MEPALDNPQALNARDLRKKLEPSMENPDLLAFILGQDLPHLSGYAVPSSERYCLDRLLEKIIRNSDPRAAYMGMRTKGHMISDAARICLDSLWAKRDPEVFSLGSAAVIDYLVMRSYRAPLEDGHFAAKLIRNIRPEDIQASTRLKRLSELDPENGSESAISAAASHSLSRMIRPDTS